MENWSKYMNMYNHRMFKMNNINFNYRLINGHIFRTL